MNANTVHASVEVSVDPHTAFRIFTEQIDSWWKRGPHNFYDSRRAKAMRFESGAGGRYLEIYDERAGDMLEIGRVTVWEPGSRLVWRCSLDDTEVDVRFEAIGFGTRVVLEQRLVEGGSRADFYTGWGHILSWFGDKAKKSDRLVHQAIPYLCIRGAGDALEFYCRAFGSTVEGEPVMWNGKVGHATLRIGDCTLFLADEAPEFGVQSPLSLGGCTCTVVLSVDDVDGFADRARKAGASLTQEPTDEPYGRTAKILDPFGHRWIISAV